jgi:hypothetical protein
VHGFDWLKSQVIAKKSVWLKSMPGITMAKIGLKKILSEFSNEYFPY